MFFMPEPVRNETNRIAAEEELRAIETEEIFDHIDGKDGDDIKITKVSKTAIRAAPTKTWVVWHL